MGDESLVKDGFDFIVESHDLSHEKDGDQGTEVPGEVDKVDSHSTQNDEDHDHYHEDQSDLAGATELVKLTQRKTRKRLKMLRMEMMAKPGWWAEMKAS